LTVADPAAQLAELRFASPRIFVGIDIFNQGPGDASVVIRGREKQRIAVTLRAGELRRVRTGWSEPLTQAEFEFQSAGAIHFDNLAYAQP